MLACCSIIVQRHDLNWLTLFLFVQEVYYTPVHGSWLNVAETELSVLARQCLERRIPDQPASQRETLVWEQRRNTQLRTIDWRFTTEDARIKLKRLYPSFQP